MKKLAFLLIPMISMPALASRTPLLMGGDSSQAYEINARFSGTTMPCQIVEPPSSDMFNLVENNVSFVTSPATSAGIKVQTSNSYIPKISVTAISAPDTIYEQSGADYFDVKFGPMGGDVSSGFTLATPGPEYELARTTDENGLNTYNNAIVFQAASTFQESDFALGDYTLTTEVTISCHAVP